MTNVALPRLLAQNTPALQAKGYLSSLGPQCIHVRLTKLSRFDGEGYKLKGSGLLSSGY